MMNTVDISVSEVHSKTPRNILRGVSVLLVVFGFNR